MKQRTEQKGNSWNKLKRKWQASENIIPMWLGVILFAVVIILSFMLLYVSRLSDDTEAVLWKYAFVQNVGDEAEENEWLNTQASTELADPKGAYIHLTHTFADSDTDRILYIDTDFAPMQIYLDQEVIYDNHLDQEDYVGNVYNAVLIPSGQKRVVDVYMTQPFSGKFRSYLEEAEEGTNPAFSFTPFFWVGAALTLAGFLAFIVSLFYGLKKRQYKGLAAVPLVAVLLGGKMVIEQLTRSTYMLNAPFWHILYRMMPFFVLWVVVFNLIHVLGASKKLIAGLSVYGLLPLLLLAAKEAAAVKWGCMALYGAGIILILILCFELSEKSVQRVQYAAACFSLGVFTFCVFAAVALSDIFYTEKAVSFDGFILIVYLIFLYFIRLRQGMEPKEDYGDLGKCCGRWVKAFSEHVAHIYSTASMPQFAATAVQELCAIVEEAEEELLKTPWEPIRACAAIRAEGGFTELYNRGVRENCDFDQIAACYSFTGKRIFLSESYFDFIFCCNHQPHVIFHFENLGPRISEFISGIGYMEYAVMDVMVQRFLLHMSEEQTLAYQEKDFSEAAAYEDYDNASAAGHIANVKQYTKILCEELGFNEEEARMVSAASALHDIGKFAIPQEVMEKNGNLCREERDMIDKHAQYGYELLSSLPGQYMQAASYIALLHHAQYTDPVPDGIEEKYIRYAQIVSVADVYDALTRKRHYKDAWDSERAYNYMNELSGKKFDPAVMQAFNNRIGDFTALREGE